MRTKPLRPLHVWEDERLISWLPNPLPALVTVMVMVFLVMIAQPILNSSEKSEVTIDHYLTNGTELTSTNGMDILIPSVDESGTNGGLI